MPKSRHKKVKAIDPFCSGSRKALLLAGRCGEVQSLCNSHDSGSNSYIDSPIINVRSSTDQRSEVVAEAGYKRELEWKEQEFNRAPKNVQDQEMSRSLKNMLKASKMAAQRQKHSVQKLGSVERRPGESHNSFMKRVGSNAKRKLHIARTKLESDEKTNERVKTESAVKKKKERLAVLQQRMKGKKFEKTIDSQEKDFYKDRVEFGEVVSAPPIFSAKPRKSSDKTENPGSRQLLLKSMLHQRQSPKDDAYSAKKPHHRTDKTSQDHASKIKRRKNMTNAEKRNFDQSREAAILAYRKAKGHAQDSIVLGRI